MSQLDANTTNLQSILDTINALPEAGSGGGGGSVETCDVTVTATNTILRTYATCYDNGTITTIDPFIYTGQSQFTIPNLVCGTALCLVTEGYGSANVTNAVDLNGRVSADMDGIFVECYRVEQP